MAPATITQPVLADKPVANCDPYIAGLLREVLDRVAAIPVVPGASIAVSGNDVLELRGAVRELNLAVLNTLKWRV